MRAANRASMMKPDRWTTTERSGGPPGQRGEAVMLPNLRTEFQITELRRQETLAAAARYRAARGSSTTSGERRGSGRPQQRIGAALVRVGQRLQGACLVAPIA